MKKRNPPNSFHDVQTSRVLQNHRHHLFGNAATTGGDLLLKVIGQEHNKLIVDWKIDENVNMESI